MASGSSQCTALMPPWKVNLSPYFALSSIGFHPRLHFERVQTVEADLDQLRDNRVDVAARMKLRNRPLGMSPLYRALWTGFRISRYVLKREELVDFVAHIIRPGNVSK